MLRREFIAGLGSTAAWPLAARAQQGDRVRRIGVLMSGDDNDPTAKARISAFAPALADLGWADGRNVRIDVRWAGGDTNRSRALAQELVGLQPDIILTSNTPATTALQRETGTIPIVFVGATDPAASGLLASLARFPYASHVQILGSSPCEKCRFNRHNSRVDWENNGQGTSPASPFKKPRWEASG